MNNELECPEKIYIYLLPEYASKLKADARHFEILKKKENTINFNQFLNMLVKGYYEQFSNVDEFLMNANHFDEADIKVKKEQIIIRPSKDNKSLFNKIVGLHSNGKGISGYFSKLIKSYCDLAMYKREQIIFNKNYLIIKKATNLKSRSRITFKIKGSEKAHEAIPYKIAISKEEMFNYLLCSELIDGNQVEMPFRLSRIDCVSLAPGDTIINKNVERHLKKMDQNAPQYQIKEDVETCVRLTEQGVKDYQRIYFGRPERIPDKDETKEDGTYYYFDCSTNQLYLYFRRLGCEAEIIYPEELKNMIKEFHCKATSLYEKE